MSPVRVLFLVPWPSEAASPRLRVGQYLPYLSAHGVDFTVRPFMSSALYRIVYEPKNLARKTAMVALSSVRRVFDLLRAQRADVVFIHREAFPFGTTMIERTIEAMGVPMVLDFDDAIYLPSSSGGHGFVQMLKNPEKVEDLVRRSRAVVVGNRHLQSFAKRFNPHSVVLPTPVDTQVYAPSPIRPRDAQVTIGWMGSSTTSAYMDALTRPIGRLLDKHPNVSVTIVGGRAHHLEKLPRVSYQPWSLSGELPLLHSFDVGLMPYPDNEWARGKCAFKALLYMSVGIPTVASAIGMAEEVVYPGVNGFLARTDDDWFDALDTLVVDAQLRKRLGEEGRRIAESDFSLAQYAPRFLGVLESVAAGQPVTNEVSILPAREPRAIT